MTAFFTVIMQRTLVEVIEHEYLTFASCSAALYFAGAI